MNHFYEIMTFLTFENRDHKIKSDMSHSCGSFIVASYVLFFKVEEARQLPKPFTIRSCLEQLRVLRLNITVIMIRG